MRLQTLIEQPNRTGKILGVNPKRLMEMPYFLCTNDPNNVVNVGANLSSTMQTMSISGEGPAQIVSLSHEKTNPVTVLLQIQDGTAIRSLMNSAVHIDTIFGNAQQPFYLPEAGYIDELRTVQAVFTDISGAGSAVRINPLCRRYLAVVADPDLEITRARMQDRQYLSTPFFYTTDRGPINVGAGATTQATITIGQEHHFELFKISAVATGLFDINIVDQARGESIILAPEDTNYQIGSELFAGTANFPYILPEPRLFQVRQKLIVTVTDRSGAPNTIYLTLTGRADLVRMWS